MQSVRLLALQEAAVIPLAWALTSFVLIRRGPPRDALVGALLLCSISICIGVAAWISLPLAERLWRRWIAALGPIDLPGMATALIGLPLLTIAFVALARRLASILRSGPHAGQPSGDRGRGEPLSPGPTPVDGAGPRDR